MLTLRTMIGPMVVLASVLLAGCEDPKLSAEKQAVVDTLRRMDAANNSSDGETAASLITSDSIARYTEVLRLGLSGKAAEINRRTAWDREEIMRMRHRGTRRELERLDARGYVVYATSQGWYRSMEEGVGWAEGLGEISIDPDGMAATVRILDWDKKASNYVVILRKEGGAWKIEEPSLEPLIADSYADAAREFGESEFDIMRGVIEDESGEPVREDIFERAW